MNTTKQKSLSPELQISTDRIAGLEASERGKKELRQKATTGTQSKLFNPEQFKNGQIALIDTVTI